MLEVNNILLNTIGHKTQSVSFFTPYTVILRNNKKKIIEKRVNSFIKCKRNKGATRRFNEPWSRKKLNEEKHTQETKKHMNTSRELNNGQ